MTMISRNHEGGLPVEASGGTTTTTYTDGNGDEYQIHAFENVGTDSFTVDFFPFYGKTIDALLVGGGGGGNDTQNNNTDRGGGGAGGLIYETGVTVQSQDYTITVGDGGVDENNGDDTTAFGLTAIGGGQGSSFTDGTDGGSGGGGGDGGAGGNALQPGSTDGGFGNPGGDGYEFATNNEPNAGAGGGGAGEAGQDGQSSEIAGDGGDGRYYGDEFSESFGESGWFAGGGGGSAEDGGRNGGQGGGGDGRTSSRSGTGGQANTGGGAGAQNPSEGGGSGIVLIRYKI
jgi:hypothetical protein